MDQDHLDQNGTVQVVSTKHGSQQILFESDSDENFDLTDSGSEYMGNNIEFSESDDEISDIEQNINTQTQFRITDNETEIIWDNDVNEMFEFPFTKQNKLLVEVENENKPIHFFFLLFDDSFINLLVSQTNIYAETEFLRVGSAPTTYITVETNK